MKEEWKIFTNRVVNLRVSNLGNVEGKIRSNKIVITIHNNRRYAGYFAIYRLVWTLFNGPLPKGYCIHHIDHNKLNDRLDNLQLMTIGEHSSMHNKNKKHRLGKNNTKEHNENISKARTGRKFPRNKNNNKYEKIQDPNESTCLENNNGGVS